MKEMLVEQVTPLPENGDIGNGRSRSDNVKPTQGGNGAEYLLRRLQRDRPDLVEKVARGEGRTKRRMGEILKTMERREQGGDQRKKQSNIELLCSPTLADIGLDRMEASRCQRIAEVPKPELRADDVAGLTLGKMFPRVGAASEHSISTREKTHDPSARVSARVK